jgi:hypothetical protein
MHSEQCCVVEIYQCFGISYCLHLLFSALKVEAVDFYETKANFLLECMVSLRRMNSTWLAEWEPQIAQSACVCLLCYVQGLEDLSVAGPC